MKGAILIINCKNYDQISTRPRLKRLLAAACAVATRYNIRIAVAPPQHLIGDAVRLLEEDIDCGKKSMVIVLAQHADCHNTGSTTGYVIPEMLKRAGVAGSIINHSEHRIRQADAACAVKRLNELNMLSVLCVRNVKETKKYADMNPDYVAIEPPELIGSGRSVSAERPTLISGAADILEHTDAKLLCGAGIASDADVSRAVELGARGILVASGIIKNDTKWKSVIAGLARPLAGM